MATKLQLRESLQISITPVMRHCIELLASGRLEFIERLMLEAETNPMLELEAPESTPVLEEPNNEMEKRLERADSSYFESYEEQGFFQRDPDAIDKNRALEQFTPATESLADHLLAQAMSRLETDKEIELAKQIVYNLDADGFLAVELGSITQLMETTGEEIERIRRLVMTFDPPGCAARNLREVLATQVGDAPEDEPLRRLIDRHLEDVARSRYEVILHDLQIDMPHLAALIARLKKLQPIPAAPFKQEAVEYAEVDLMLLREENTFRVVYVDEGIPRLMLSKYYQEMLDKTSDRETQHFLKDRYRDAQFFIEGVELRKKTILRIAEYLVKAQQDFLLFGEKWKRPLSMRDVAREVGLNESTVSRSVNGKFMASAKGLLSLRSFFSHSIKGDFGFAHSVDTVRDKVREIIAAEPPGQPMSDEEITLRLKELGIPIARRTVRNYREELNIPSSFVRKKRIK